MDEWLLVPCFHGNRHPCLEPSSRAAPPSVRAIACARGISTSPLAREMLPWRTEVVDQGVMIDATLRKPPGQQCVAAALCVAGDRAPSPSTLSTAPQAPHQPGRRALIRSVRGAESDAFSRTTGSDRTAGPINGTGSGPDDVAGSQGGGAIQKGDQLILVAAARVELAVAIAIPIQREVASRYGEQVTA